MRKLKIMSSKPEIPDDELSKYMNFDALLAEKRVADARKEGISRTTKLFTWVGTALVISFAVFTFLNKPEMPKQKETQLPVTPDPASGKKDLEIIETPSDSTASVSEQSETDKKLQTPAVTKKKSEPNVSTIQTEEPAPGKETFEYIEAEPVAGYPGLYAYFERELKYPEEAMADSVSGIVTVSFILNQEGKPEQLKVVNSLGEPFTREAVRIIEEMPAWKPATLNGKPVQSRVSLPLSFQYKKINVKE